MGSGLSGILGWDRAVFEIINQDFSGGFLNTLLPFFSDFRIWLLPLGIVWTLFFWRTNRYGRLVAIGCFFVVVATDQVSDSVIKPAVQRVRPCNVIPAVNFYDDNGKWLVTDKFGLTTYKPSYGFPSSHAANVAGQATYWSFFYPQAAPFVISIAAVVCYSRIYLGHHYPLDVLGGYLVGVVFALFVAFILRRWIIPD